MGWTGSTFRKEIDSDYVTVAKAMEKSGKLASYSLLDAGNSLSTQISQVDALILKHVSLIIIDPTSTTGLNGAIAKAHQAGIPVIVISDGPVTSTIPYEIYAQYNKLTEAEAVFIAKQLHGVGNVLEVQGIAGLASTVSMLGGMTKGFSAYPGIKVVGSVYGDYSESTTESAVAAILPSLPTVNAVITSTIEAYGAVQAFQAAGRPVPLAIGDGCACFADWALTQAKTTAGYSTINLSANPDIGGVAAYLALDILNHVKVPKTMIMPYLNMPQSQFGQFSKFPSDYSLQVIYSNAWVNKNLLK
jgi:ribose transport system substrate-binding protein